MRIEGQQPDSNASYIHFFLYDFHVINAIDTSTVMKSASSLTLSYAAICSAAHRMVASAEISYCKRSVQIAP